MKEKTRTALANWLSNHPESYHPCDMDRFFFLIQTASKSSDLRSLVALDLAAELKKYKPGWEDVYVQAFCEKWKNYIQVCCGLMEFINSND